MRIVCPSCSATFEVPKTRLAQGQAVRCARCGTDWTPLAEPGPALPVQTAEPLEQSLPARGMGPVTLPTPPTASAVRPLSLLAPILERLNLAVAGEPVLIASWAVSIAVVIGLGWAAVTWRSSVMHAWPPSERLYTALGLPADR